uniref:Uncharacterized protein n=1 Tax=Zea mays TaxID=4577 RepID=A0A804Q078_MAIZE
MVRPLRRRPPPPAEGGFASYAACGRVLILDLQEDAVAAPPPRQLWRRKRGGPLMTVTAAWRVEAPARDPNAEMCRTLTPPSPIHRRIDGLRRSSWRF